MTFVLVRVMRVNRLLRSENKRSTRITPTAPRPRVSRSLCLLIPSARSNHLNL